VRRPIYSEKQRFEDMQKRLTQLAEQGADVISVFPFQMSPVWYAQLDKADMVVVEVVIVFSPGVIV